jgi:peptide chain release factor 2
LRSGTLFDLPAKQARRKELEAKMGEPGFWDNQEAAKGIVSELKTLKASIDPVDQMFHGLEEVESALPTRRGSRRSLIPWPKPTGC